MMLKSRLCDYSDAYIFVKGTIIMVQKQYCKNCAPFADCISGTNNTQIDNAKDIDVVMPMYNSIEYGDTYSKTTEILWQYYRDEPSLNDNGAINNFPGNSALFKQKITCETGADCTKDVKIMVSLKYLSNFWRTLDMPLIAKLISFKLGL